MWGYTQGDIRSASCLLICQMKCRANGANGLPIIVALMASVHANRPWQSRPAVPAMRCSGSCYKANGAAGRIAAALVLMRATRLSPGRTQAAAEPTARPTAAAVSTDSNENDPNDGQDAHESALSRGPLTWPLHALAAPAPPSEGRI